MSGHTQNLKTDGRASLCVTEQALIAASLCDFTRILRVSSFQSQIGTIESGAWKKIPQDAREYVPSSRDRPHAQVYAHSPSWKGKKYQMFVNAFKLQH